MLCRRSPCFLRPCRVGPAPAAAAVSWAPAVLGSVLQRNSEADGGRDQARSAAREPCSRYIAGATRYCGGHRWRGVAPPRPWRVRRGASRGANGGAGGRTSIEIEKRRSTEQSRASASLQHSGTGERCSLASVVLAAAGFSRRSPPCHCASPRGRRFSELSRTCCFGLLTCRGEPWAAGPRHQTRKSGRLWDASSPRTVIPDHWGPSLAWELGLQLTRSSGSPPLWRFLDRRRLEAWTLYPACYTEHRR